MTLHTPGNYSVFCGCCCCSLRSGVLVTGLLFIPLGLWPFADLIIDMDYDAFTSVLKVLLGLGHLTFSAFFLWALHMGKADTLELAYRGLKLFVAVSVGFWLGLQSQDIYRVVVAEDLVDGSVDAYRARLIVLVSVRTVILLVLLSSLWFVLGSVKSLARVLEANGTGRERKSALELAHPRLSQVFKIEEVVHVVKQQRRDS